MNEDFKNKWISQLKKGTLSFIVLSILNKGEAYYGYDLISEIKQITDIDIAEGTLYPLLIRLKNENLVTYNWIEQQSGIPRKYYKISKEGIETLIQMKIYWDQSCQSINNI